MDPARFSFHRSGDVYTQSDKELPIEAVLNMELPPCPYESSLACHWLAVEGVQPSIPENPLPSQRATIQKKRKADSSVDVKPEVKHVLTKELQLFFQQVIKGIRAPVEAMAATCPLKEAVIESLGQDPGLHQLLPYLSQFFADEVTANLRNLPLLTSLLRMVWAILLNEENMHVEPYLHQWLPALLTCLVGKKLCAHNSEDHWALRDFAARIIARICARYGTAYATMQPRILRTLVHAFLDPQKPLTTHYGAVVGLTALGSSVVESLLMPNLLFYVEKCINDTVNHEQIATPIPMGEGVSPVAGKSLSAQKPGTKKGGCDTAALFASMKSEAMAQAEEEEAGPDQEQQKKLASLCTKAASEADPSEAKGGKIDKGEMVRRLESEMVMQALRAATGMALRMRPTAFPAKPRKARQEGASLEGMPAYPELVEIFGEGLLPHTMPGIDKGLVATADKARGPPAVAKPKKGGLGKPCKVQAAGGIGGLFL